MITNLLSPLKEWQTLFSGLLAIVAALIGGAFITGQTKSQERVEERRQQRIREATRAALPIVLGGVIDWTEAMARCVLQIARLTQTPESLLNPPTGRVEVPAFATGEITQLKEAVAVSHPRASQRCISLLHKMQVTDARVRGGADGVNRVSTLRVSQDNVSGYALDLCEVYALAESLYSYGRGTMQDGPVDPPPVDELLKALHVLGLDRLEIDDARERAERRAR